MSFNGMLFEDLTQRLKQLSELLSISVKTKDAGVASMHQEARLYMFLACHTTLNDLLKSIYEESGLVKKEGADPRNAPGEVLTWMLKEKMVDKQQVMAMAEQYEAAGLLSYDGAWLTTPEDQKVFQDTIKKIPRFYYGMNSFVVNFSKRIVFYQKGQNG